MKKYKYYIGIDCGVNTGVCAWSRADKQIFYLASEKIHSAMERVSNWHKHYPGQVMVRVEDARLRKWFGEKGIGALQGAGSVKRDSKIWEDFLKDLGVAFEMVNPKDNATKMDAQRFNMWTGYKGSTNEHSRDAAALVVGM